MIHLPSSHPASAWRIGLDQRDLGLRHGTGIATYAHQILAAVAGWGAQACLLRDTAGPHGGAMRAFRAGLMPPDARFQSEIGSSGGIYRLAQAHFDLWRRPLRLRARCRLDLMHWTSPLPLRVMGVPNIVTVYDLIPLRTPNLTGTNPHRYRRLVSAALRGADAILAISEATRREVIAAFPACAPRLHVVSPAVRLPDLPGPVETAAQIEAAIGCAPGAYYIHPGTIEPRKNLPRLIEAFLASGVAGTLVLVGPDGWNAAAELAPYADAIGPPGSGRPVIRPGYVSRPLLLALLQGARALLYPSLAEGFGVPILEAMLLGTPVLTSAGGATEEVAGAAALLVDPASSVAIAAGIQALGADAALRARLAEAGRSQAKMFSADCSRQKLERIYACILRADDGGPG